MFQRTLIVASLLFVGAPALAGEPTTIGPKACATCHSAQHTQWQGHAHARAYQSLPAKDRTNPLCLTCHAPDPERPEAGVTCEACHGAGSEYQEAHVMRDPYLRGYLGLKDSKLKDCQTCHQADHGVKLKPLDLAAIWNKLHHGNTPPTPAP